MDEAVETAVITYQHNGEVVEAEIIPEGANVATEDIYVDTSAHLK